MRRFVPIVSVFVVMLVLAACVERKEHLAISPDGSVLWQVRMGSDSMDDLLKGDAVPTPGGLWIVHQEEQRDDDGNVTHSTGEAHFARVLDGRAIQDVFINPQRADRIPDSPKFANWYGTTFRCFDPAIRAWRVFWFNPDDGVRAELIGRRRGNDIVQDGHFPDGTPIRWTFSEVTPDSFRWRGERLEPHGKTWLLQVEFHARRI